MAVITVGTPRPVVPARRLALDPAELTVLADRAEVTLPPDLRFEVDEVAVRLDGTTAEDLLAAAEQRLRQRGVLDGDGGVPGPVLANLHGVVGGRQRVRTTYGGGGLEVVAYHWVSPGAGGSLVRVGDGIELSAYDDRSWGRELLRMVPERPPVPSPVEAEHVWRLDDLATAGAVADDLDEQPPAVVGPVLGLAAADWDRLRAFVGGCRGVLHCVVADPGGGLPAELVWFDTVSGWWAVSPRDTDEEREVVCAWRGRGGILTDLALVTTRWWA